MLALFGGPVGNLLLTLPREAAPRAFRPLLDDAGLHDGNHDPPADVTVLD